MQELILCGGTPASGKTTWAKAWIHEAPNRVRVNRDDIRLLMFAKFFGVNESLVTKVEDAMIHEALRMGQSVVVDDTNISFEYIERMTKIGLLYGANVVIKQFDIDLEEAKHRNRVRHENGGNFVPEDVIERMHDALRAGPNPS